MANTKHRLAMAALVEGALEELECLRMGSEALARVIRHEESDGSHEWDELVATRKRHDRYMSAIHAMLPILLPNGGLRSRAARSEASTAPHPAVPEIPEMGSPKGESDNGR